MMKRKKIAKPQSYILAPKKLWRKAPEAPGLATDVDIEMDADDELESSDDDQNGTGNQGFFNLRLICGD